jgi:hypothetical protein
MEELEEEEKAGLGELLLAAAKLVEEANDYLQEVYDSLPAAPQEAAEDDIADPDVLTEQRAVIGCVVADMLRPAIADLKAAAAYQPAQPGEKRTRPKEGKKRKAGRGGTA